MDARLTHDSLGPSERTTQPADVSIGSAVFAQVTVEYLMLYSGTPFFPKMSLPVCDLDIHRTHGSLGQPEC